VPIFNGLETDDYAIMLRLLKTYPNQEASDAYGFRSRGREFVPILEPDDHSVQAALKTAFTTPTNIKAV
jgi:hypothetical protein